LSIGEDSRKFVALAQEIGELECFTAVINQSSAMPNRIKWSNAANINSLAKLTPANCDARAY